MMVHCLVLLKIFKVIDSYRLNSDRRSVDGILMGDTGRELLSMRVKGNGGS